jgi:zinc D-Ala-D-Ala carboxypeptidase
MTHGESSWPRSFSRDELLRSERATRLGIPNAPTPEHEANLRALAWHVLQPLRDALGGPIRITSGYRSPALNAATPGSSKTSQHSLGQAADLVPGAGAPFTAADIFHHIRLHLPYDQLIWEYGDARAPRWVHVSFRDANRRGLALHTTGTPAAPSYATWRAA